MNGNHPDDTSFYLYVTGENHTVNNGTDNYGARWNGTDGFTWITSNSYTLTIPANASVNTGTQDVSVSNVALTEVTKNVKVKIGNTASTLDTSGNLTLNRFDNQTITTNITISGTPLAPSMLILSTGIGETDTKTLSFAHPKQTNILAGIYIGTLTFVASVE